MASHRHGSPKGDRHVAEGGGWPSGDEAGDTFGQWQWVHLQGVQGSADGEWPGASLNQAALPRGKWIDRAVASDASGGVGWGRVGELAGSGESVWTGSEALLGRTIAQCLGIPGTEGLLPRQPGGKVRREASQTGRVRHQRRERNLELRQQTLPFQA